MRGQLPAGTTCDAGILSDAVDAGIAVGARFLEIYDQDVVGFPDVNLSAHNRLNP